MATDRLGSILVLVRVAETGSFAAARVLGVSPSAVKGEARLDERLRHELFQRTT